MSEDDPRHGTYAGAVAHWGSGGRPCKDCARAETRYRKRRKMRALNGDPATVPAIGTLRRIQALHALGHTGPQIAATAGISVHSMRSIAYHGVATVRASTAQSVAAVYEQLCMVRPIGHYANRARSIAARRGWPPPLAWDDIDNPDETPADWHYTPVSRAETLAELDAMHAGISTVCRTLNVSRETLERWCERHGHRDIYERLTAREQPRYWVNQHAEGGVA